MKTITLISLILALFISNEYKLVSTVSVQGNAFKTDILDNVYIIKDKTLTKYNTSGEKLFTYNNNLGNISFIDATDPFKILVFYKDFNQIIFLDKTLSIIGSPILLDNLGFDGCELVCSSSTGSFWLYNSQTTQLILIDKNLQIKLQSVSINSILSVNSKPNYMIEKTDYIYLNVPDRGIMMFDKFGTYNKLLPIQDLHSFQVLNNKIVYFKRNKLFSFDAELFVEKSIDIPDTTNVKDVRIEQNKLFIFKENQFLVYQNNNN